MAATLDLAQLANFGIGSAKLTENDVLSHSIDIFKPAQKEMSHVHGRTISIRPVSKESSGPFDFNINAQGLQFVQTGLTWMTGQCRIVNSDGSSIAAEKNVSVCNLFPAALFKGVDLIINGTPISDLSSNLANYKRVVETYLSYGSDARRGHLRAAMLIPDTDGKVDDMTATAASAEPSTGYQKRAAVIKGSRRFDWILPLHHDFMVSLLCA
jgi:hypothetical protein